MSKIAFMTYAHNAQDSLKLTIESVLNQTYTNLVYYLVDNASTDNTLAIMKEYASIDVRVKVVQNDNSLVMLQKYINEIEDCEYFAVLDADDRYEPGFAEEMISFMLRETLDIAICGFCAYTKHGEVIGGKQTDTTVLTKTEIVDNILDLQNYMRTIWGKVYKIQVMRQMDFSSFNLAASQHVFYAIDTIFCISAITASNKIGILKDTLHCYLVNEESISYRYELNRFAVICIMIYDWIQFVEKFGQNDENSFYFILWVYFEEVNAIVEILMKSNLRKEARIAEIEKIMQFPLTKSWLDFVPDTKAFLEKCLNETS